MKNIVVLFIALSIGYLIGWYQFSYNASSVIATVDTNTIDTTKNDGDKNDESSGQIAKVISQIDSDNVTETVSKLSSIDNISYTDLAGLVLSPTVEKVNNVIDSMNEAELQLALGTITVFGNEELGKIENTSNFAKRLLSIALFKDPQKTDSTEEATSIIFGTEVNTNNSVSTPSTRFGQDTKKIYASFSLSERPEQVFIKWYQSIPYKLRLFNKYKINTSEVNNYVWYGPKKWEPGVYVVEIYTINEELTVLAKGNFEIIDELNKE